ncbi:MAG: MerR family transcriptional regulator [Gammaproteobacteria bacterium]|nr:MerR family transcriptional regulator [Gammaproteobacteria bacterium]
MGNENLRGISAAAREAECGESTMRSLDRRGIVPALRDSAGRRLYDEPRIQAVRRYLAKRKGSAR